MDPVRAALERAADTGLIPRGGSVLLAVSGGADSTALLHAAAAAAPGCAWKLSVGHVHHGWRAREADRDLAFVEDRARRLGLRFVFRRRDARAASRDLGLSPEAGARHVRYQALHEMARELGAGLVATAHQEDDVLESLLLARRRRGGLARLAGPRTRREDGVVRPLLSVTRAAIVRFLEEGGLPFRRDGSNGDLRLVRNAVRRELAGFGPDARRELALEAAALRRERDGAEEELSKLEGLRLLPEVSLADAETLSRCRPDTARLALFRMAAPFTRPGRPPATGRERERILRLLATGADFRFEAGRRIRFERRGSLLSVRRRDPGAPEVYDSAQEGGRIVP